MNCNVCKKPCGSNFIKILMGTHADKTGKVRRFFKKVCDNCSIWCEGCGRYRLPINSIAVTEWNGYCDDCVATGFPTYPYKCGQEVDDMSTQHTAVYTKEELEVEESK